MAERRRGAPEPANFAREFRAHMARMTAGLTPAAFATAWADWAMHLTLSLARPNFDHPRNVTPRPH
ncbi:MAG: poly-beta-hydroxybutyrate polymerase N-terminal domain-containing protein [Burkholderiaceae bacterium]|nr:poly-beta-hydroxybutyrate polymerase N-terminal domain-containing protein [Burkholderiaceae bacterium]